jgi:hypothetical protein
MTDHLPESPEVVLSAEEREALIGVLDRASQEVGHMPLRPIVAEVERILTARLTAQAAEHEREVAALRESKDRWRTRAKEAQNELGDLRAAIGLSDTWTVDDSIGVYRHRAEAAERALADLRAGIEALADEWLEAGVVENGTYPETAVAAEDMCARALRALLATEDRHETCPNADMHPEFPGMECGRCGHVTPSRDRHDEAEEG